MFCNRELRHGSRSSASLSIDCIRWCNFAILHVISDSSNIAMTLKLHFEQLGGDPFVHHVKRFIKSFTDQWTTQNLVHIWLFGPMLVETIQEYKIDWLTTNASPPPPIEIVSPFHSKHITRFSYKHEKVIWMLMSMFLTFFWLSRIHFKC